MAYTVRSPASEAEAEAWGAFCGERGFAHRPGAPDRFTRKLRADPSATLERIIMAVPREEDDAVRAGAAPPRVVGSTRLFDRLLALAPAASEGATSAPPPVARMLGWGEVCSDPDLRGQGIVGMVLKEAVARMEAAAAGGNGGCGTVGGAGAPPPPCLSLLHAAPGVAGMYEKFGFQRGVLAIPFAQVALPGCAAGGDAALQLPAETPAVAVSGAEAPLPGCGGWRVRLTRFDADWRALETLRAATVARCGVAGWVARDEAYWRRWVANACKGRAWCLLPPATAGASGAASEATACCSAGCGCGCACGGSGSGAGAAASCGCSCSTVQQAAPGSAACGCTCGSGGATPIAAYGYALWREGCYRVMDWAACDAGALELSGFAAQGEPQDQAQPQPPAGVLKAFLRWLVADAAALATALGAPPGALPADAPELQVGGAPSVAMPLPLALDAFGPGAPNVAEAPALADGNWMLRPLQAAGSAGEAAVAALTAASARGRFLMFGADFF